MNALDPPRLTFGLRLLRVSRIWRREANEMLARYNLSEATTLPLVLLRAGGSGLRQGALAAELGIEGPSLVRLLDQLSADGLVERREDPTDRRARTIHLTERGCAMLEQVDAALHDLRLHFLAGLKDNELEACLTAFDKIEAVAGAARTMADMP